MFIKTRIPIYALTIKRAKPTQSSTIKPQPSVFYFRHRADAVYYQNTHFKNIASSIQELDAIEDNGQIKHFHYKPSAAKHHFGAFILDEHLRMQIMQLDEWVLVGLNRPFPNKRIAGSPATLKEAKHFIWVGKQKNELVMMDAKLINKPIVFAVQRSLI